MHVMSSEWGRIDEAGTVFVRTADGEREIGSWQAGDAEAGLAYYTRGYEDLQTEVNLLAKRLESGAGDPKATKSQAMTLHASLPTVAAVGDLAALDGELVSLITAADAKMGEQAEAREAARAEAIAKKEALAAEAETIAESSTQWKAAGDRLRAIVEEWKLIKGIDRKTDDALWKRFAAARDAFGKRRGSHFAQLDTERDAAKSDQGEAGRPRRGTVRLGGLARDRGGAEAADDRVEGRARAPTATPRTRCGSGSERPRTPSSSGAPECSPNATPSRPRT